MRASDAERIEQRRLSLQAALDACKDGGERNRLGQFATPTALARDIAAFGRDLLGAGKTIRFLDPAIGTGAFFSALCAEAPPSRIGRCLGFEIDSHYGDPASALWRDTPLAVRLADFTAAAPPDGARQRANLLLCNPPYVRHHHIERDRKRALQALVDERVGIRPSGLSGLYCYFLWLSHAWLAPGAVSGWLIPSEWMDVNYGQQVKEYLLSRVRLVRIHRFEPRDVQFSDALVSSAIVWFRNAAASDDAPVEISCGGSLAAPERLVAVSRERLRETRKWTRLAVRGQARVVRGGEAGGADDRAAGGTGTTLGDLFAIKRGVATGANAFFVLSREQVVRHGIPQRFIRPILPSPRHLESDEIEAAPDGSPAIARPRFLLAIARSERALRTRHPAVWAYLQSGIAAGIHERYLPRHRTPWYTQEERSAAPLLCTYMGRGTGEGARPFRFILNRSQAIAANVYLLLYPRPVMARALEGDPGLMRAIWRALNRLPVSALVGEGRVYGGGLYKLEPGELARVPLSAFAAAVPGVLDAAARLRDERSARTA